MCYNDSFDPSLNAKRLMECGERVRDSGCEEDCSLWCSWKIRKSRYILAVTFFFLLLLAMFFKVFKKLNRKAKSSNRNVRRRSRERKQQSWFKSESGMENKTKVRLDYLHRHVSRRFATISWLSPFRQSCLWRKFHNEIGKFVISALNDRIVICSSSSTRPIINLSADWQTMNNPLSVKWHVSCLFSIFRFNFLLFTPELLSFSVKTILITFLCYFSAFAVKAGEETRLKEKCREIYFGCFLFSCLASSSKDYKSLEYLSSKLLRFGYFGKIILGTIHRMSFET